MTFILISVILLTPIDSFARGGGGGGGGRGGRNGGMMGGGMMGGGMMGGMGGQMDPTMMQNMRGGFNQPVFDVNNFKTSKLLTYLVDANGVKVDPNSLSEATLQSLYVQIGRGDPAVIDTTRFSSLTQVSGVTLGQGIVDPNDPDPMISVNLNGLNINAIITMLIQWTGKAVLPSNDALGLTITVFSPERMRQSEALSLLYSAMRQQGFVAETRNNIIYIKPVSQAQQIYAPLVSEDEELSTFQDKLTVIRKIYRVKNYSASTMGQLILPFLNPTGNITADETTQTLMVTDTVESLMQVEKIMNRFDNTLAGTTTEILKVQHADPAEMADMISSIMANNLPSTGMLGGFNMGGMMGGMMGGNMRGQQQTRGTTSSRTTTATTRGTTSRNSQGTTQTSGRTSGRTNNPTNMMSMGMFGAASAGASSIGSEKAVPTLIPDAVNKIIIATATPEDMKTVKYWLAQLDTETKVVWNPADLKSLDENQIVQKIYDLKYNTPEQLAQIIQPLLTDNGYLSAEQNTGTLLIRDTVGTLRQIEDIIKEFDKEEANPEVRQIFEVKRGDPQEIVNIINAIISGQATATSTTGRATTGRTTTGRTTTGRTTTGRTTGFGF